MSKELVKAIADMREEEALKLVREMVEGGSGPIEVLDTARETVELFHQHWEAEKKNLSLHSSVAATIDSHLGSVPLASMSCLR